MNEVESELENVRKWARKAVVLQEQQAAEIERLNKLWKYEHAIVVRLVAERDSVHADLARVTAENEELKRAWTTSTERIVAGNSGKRRGTRMSKRGAHEDLHLPVKE